MGIWKWMKNSQNHRNIPVFMMVCFFSAGTLSAESSIGLRLLPTYYFPISDPLFVGGIGGAIALDYKPKPFFGFFAQGEYMSISLQNVAPLTLFDGSLGAGFVYRMNDRYSSRADLMAGIYSVSRASARTSGVSAGFRISGDYHISPSLAATVHAGFRHYASSPTAFMSAISAGVGLTVDVGELFNKKARISTETIKQDPVFPVLYSWYDNNGFAVVKITNNETTTITDIETSFYLEQYMGQPKQCDLTKSLKPGESFDVPLKGFFNESMLDLTEKIGAEAKVLISYRSLGAIRTAQIPVQIPVCDRNAMSWDDDRRAAAFVSSKDPAALWFSKYVSGIVRNRFRKGVNNNMQYAMGVFEALNAYGLNYVIDPSSSYAANVGSTSIDFLQFPYQTLMYRGGDCDDLSILFCSLIEAVGIESAFITIPGHIFLAFSSGMTEEEAKANFYAPDQLIYKDGKAWVPLEITLTKEGFNKAWRVGAKEWNDSAARGTANLYPMQDSWKIYKPVSVPGAASRFNLPDEEKTALAFDSALNTYVEREIRPQILVCQNAIVSSDTAENRNALGVLYGKYGMIENAKIEFTLAAGKKYVPAWTNLGNIAFMEQKYTEALRYYSYASSVNSDDTIALLGEARCYYELEEFEKSDSLYAELGKKDAALGQQYAYLGSFFETQGRAWSLSDRLSTTTWNLPLRKKDGSILVTAQMVASVTEVVESEKVKDTPVRSLSSKPVRGGLTGMLSIVQSDVVPVVAVKKSKATVSAPVASVVQKPVVAVSKSVPAVVKTAIIESSEIAPLPAAVASVPVAVASVPAAVATAPIAVAAVVTAPVAVVTAPVAVVTAPVAVVTAPVAVATAPVAVVTAPVAVVTVPAAVVTEPVAVASVPVAVASEPAAVAAVVTAPVAVATAPVAVVTAPVAVASVPAAVATAPAVDGDNFQITPSAIKEVYAHVAVKEKKASVSAVVETAYKNDEPITEIVVDEPPELKNNTMPIVVAIIAGISAIVSATVMTIRFRVKRKNLTRRNKP